MKINKLSTFILILLLGSLITIAGSSQISNINKEIDIDKDTDITDYKVEDFLLKEETKKDCYLNKVEAEGDLFIYNVCSTITYYHTIRCIYIKNKKICQTFRITDISDKSDMDKWEEKQVLKVLNNDKLDKVKIAEGITTINKKINEVTK